MMSSAPCAFSDWMIAGTSVLCPAASVDTPIACTSFSIAWRAHSSGVWKSGPMSTSKPRSANAVATTLAPRSWPSWPSLAIITRGRRPCASANSAISPWSCAHPSALSYAAAYTPVTFCVSARWRPQTCSSASLTSPTVARARIAWIDRSSRLPLPVRADSVSASSAARTARASRDARRRARRCT
jgi:hypothetical protein